jgi:hypothetical protein
MAAGFAGVPNEDKYLFASERLECSFRRELARLLASIAVADADDPLFSDTPAPALFYILKDDNEIEVHIAAVQLNDKLGEVFGETPLLAGVQDVGAAHADAVGPTIDAIFDGLS